MSNLIAKYNIPGPRYTSYPTVPYWEGRMDEQIWRQHVKQAFDQSNAESGMSLYIHLPYCESLCTFCGCNTRITVNHAVEGPYMETLKKEWALYREIFGARPRIRELHLGGGTPTFFSPENLSDMLQDILSHAEVTEDHAFGFEAHPRNTTRAHLEALRASGFRRLSLGIQDFDPVVQDVVNRHQSFEQVREVTDCARELGYTSINFDLIYGLPFQKRSSVEDTVNKVLQLMPDRIAFYSYAHVPWIKPGQRKFTEDDLPSDAEKRSLYELGKGMLEDAGYIEIGMDHFALETDELYLSAQNRTLHRNFMGYTPVYTRLMVGLGVSSIGDSWTAFGQNKKVVEEYMKDVQEGKLPIFRGHELNDEDLFLRKQILNLMCHMDTEWPSGNAFEEVLTQGKAKLVEMEEDDLIEVGPNSVTIKPQGKPFLRNACMAFDARLWRSKPKEQIFSKTI
ncbi:MAG: oxygen-independent coproporphyrinogen III oxidase [Flavobacteriales bacterium]|nr:oxygen-independent coproporphyrinogen III oxidase [Flavobacteriales bacterium]